MKTVSVRICVASALAVLAACGTDSQTSTIDTTSTARGTLVANPPLRIASLDAATFTATLNASANGKQLLQIAGPPACGVDFHYINYWTVNASPTGDVPASATGALMIPTGAAGACSGPRPILLYAHGTQTDRNVNIADPTDPQNSEGGLIAAMFAAHGYIVVAPNYVGYDASNGSYHPWLNADAQSKDMIDALTAARKALGKVLASSTTDNGKLFISGYSQGGYVAMATHKAMQAAGMPVTASGPMSGPYAIAANADAIMLGQVNLGATVFLPLLTTSYQKSYGNIYAAPTDLYEANYATTIEGLLPNAASLNQLFLFGQLPPQHLFHDTVWNTGSPQLDFVLDVPAFNPANPATALFAAGFGAGNLMKDSYRLAYVEDALANMDGALLPPPMQPTLQLAAAPANTFRQDLKLNDLRSWVPQRPVFLCAGGNDPTVYYLNTDVISGWWQGLGVPVARTAAQLPVSLVAVLNIDLSDQLHQAGLGAGDPFAPLEQGFLGALQQTAAAAAAAAPGDPTAGQAAVVQAYHGLVAPFCAAAVRGYFAGF
jgi:predicted esterase